MTAILGSASAAKLVNFATVDLTNTIITLNSDWTIDRTDQAGFAENPWLASNGNPRRKGQRVRGDRGYGLEYGRFR